MLYNYETTLLSNAPLFLPQLSHSIIVTTRSVFFFVSWMARPRPNGETGVPRGALRRGIAWLLFPIWLLSVSLTCSVTLFHWRSNPVGVPLQHHSLSSSSSSSPSSCTRVFVVSKRKRHERERERGDLLNCRLKSFTSFVLRRLLKIGKLEMRDEWKW